MLKGFIAAMGLSLMMISGAALAQVPPDIAAGIHKIGPIVDPVNTAKLYAPLFKDQKEPYAGVTVTRDVAYGPDALNKLDVFTTGPAQPGKTVVVYVHGGGFERGDKRQGTTPFYDNVMLWATKQGWVGVNINYRLAPKNHWPDAHQDMAAAVRWIKANIAQYGGDPNRIVLWGQSAGASLIAGYLAHPQFYGPDGHGVKGAILNSGFYDNGMEGSAYFGKDPKELQERSSVEGMKKLTIPLLISHTEVDLPDAIVQADNVKKALCGVGKCPTYLELKDHSHMSQNYSVGTSDVSLSGPALQFIRAIK
jgi:dipeptidyl aminopeptidase/acylaminoacyl peptidase